MQLAGAAHGVEYFRVIEGTPYLPVFTTALLPAGPSAGALAYDSTLDKPVIYTGSAWVELCTATITGSNDYFTVVNGLPIIPIKAGAPGGTPSSGSVYCSDGGKIQVYTTAWADFDSFEGLNYKPGFKTGSRNLYLEKNHE